MLNSGNIFHDICDGCTIETRQQLFDVTIATTVTYAEALVKKLGLVSCFVHVIGIFMKCYCEH